MITKSHWIMDYETIVNCFVAVFIDYKDDSAKKFFIVTNGRNDFPEFVDFLNQCKSKKEWHISINGLNFDAQISQYVLNNQKTLLKEPPDVIASMIYQFAQSVIDKSNRGEFLPYYPSKLSIRQIDLFKMNHWDNRAKICGLKWAQYAMDWYNVEEMPHPHTKPVTDLHTLNKVVGYCINDVLSTKKVYEHSKEQVALRQTLSKEYNLDLYSASEPRISKELFLHFLSEKLGWEKSHIKTLRTKRPVIYLGQCILPYVEFKTPEFQKVLDYFKTKVITSTKDGFKYSLNYKGVKTDYGLGGIHGATNPGVYEAKPGWTIMTSDVISYYPNLAIKNKWAPAHLPQKEFCEQYEWFFEERIKIPKSNPKNYVYKIILNSTYGLTGDENSFLYDPQMTMQITINGQLLLSMLYEMLSLAIPEGIPLMQNTDGLEMMIPTHMIPVYMKVCYEWQALTKLELEHDEYSKMVVRDVNNYIAVLKSKEVNHDDFQTMQKKAPHYIYTIKDGKYYYSAVKCKGAFEWEDLEKKKVSVFHKNKSFLIIPKAIYAYFVNGIKPEEFLEQNQNIFDYCGAVKAKAGWYFETRSIIDGYLSNKKLQKIVRYFVSNGGDKIVKCHHDGREIQVEAGEWKQTILNKVDDKVSFSQYDINLKYYLEEIYKQIEQMEKIENRSSTQLSLF